MSLDLELVCRLEPDEEVVVRIARFLMGPLAADVDFSMVDLFSVAPFDQMNEFGGEYQLCLSPGRMEEVYAAVVVMGRLAIEMCAGRAFDDGDFFPLVRSRDMAELCFGGEVQSAEGLWDQFLAVDRRDRTRERADGHATRQWHFRDPLVGPARGLGRGRGASERIRLACWQRPVVEVIERLALFALGALAGGVDLSAVSVAEVDDGFDDLAGEHVLEVSVDPLTPGAGAVALVVAAATIEAYMGRVIEQSDVFPTVATRELFGWCFGGEVTSIDQLWQSTVVAGTGS